jgi:uncharacterized protein (TIGR00255 family)
MIHSMTAFGRERAATPQGDITVELRSVNHRYLDLNFKIPDSLRALEPQLRAGLTAKLARGKVDCLMRIQSQGERDLSLNLDRDRLRQLVSAIAEVNSALAATRDPSPLEVLLFPGVCRLSELSEEELQRTAGEIFERALASLAENRQREGEKLAQLINTRLARVAEIVSATRELLPGLMQQQRERILDRLAELDIEPDQNRLEQELVYLAQKADVDEELDRLDAHIAEVRRTLARGGPCGRRLDFLMQELNREANTLSSKSFSSSTTQQAVELKVLIEQMREQIQNIE